jgi:CRISPR-associated protein Cas1
MSAKLAAILAFPRRSGSGSPWLDEMLAPRQLREAWRRVRANHGGAGADRVSLERFGRALGPQLAALADSVRAGTYQPLPPLMLRLVAGGKERDLAIPAVRDRVLQRAALDVLNRHLDPGFAPASFGYRPGLGVPDAVAAVLRLRAAGYAWAADADIRDCFGQLDHGVIRAAVRAAVPDPAARALIDQWLAAGGAAGRGIALGSVISPMLCNLTLDRLDRDLARGGHAAVRYADDFLVLCPTERAAQQALRAAERSLRALKLEFNPEKTRVARLDEGIVFLGVEFRDGVCRAVKPGGAGLIPRGWEEWRP